MSLNLSPEEDAKLVRALIAYDDAKRAYLVAKKMASADLEKVAKVGSLTTAEDAMMRACARDATAHLAAIRSILGT